MSGAVGTLPACPSVEDKLSRRWHLLELAIEGGAPLAQAVQDAALADAWLTGALESGRVLGLDMAFGKVRDPDARPTADQAGGVVPVNTPDVVPLYGGDGS